jgi:hypothetical protein
MTTSTSTRKRHGLNVTKGKQGFQETEKSVSATRLEDMRTELGADPLNAVTRDLNASRAFDLRWKAQRALQEAGQHPDSRYDRAQNMRVVANAQVYVLLNDEDIAPEEAWNSGGIDAARNADNGGANRSGTSPLLNDNDPLLAERRDAIGEHMLHKAMESYEAFGETNGAVAMYHDKEGDRDAYIEAACLAMDDDGRTTWIANEIKSIVDGEVEDGRDPRNLDVKELYIQARTTVDEKSGAAKCPTCGSATVFDVDFGYSHCPTCG